MTDQRTAVVCSNVILDDGGLLLVKEAKPSALGRWSLPAGKLEHGETLRQGAAREALEETGLVVDVGPLLGIYHCLETLEGGSSLTFVFRSEVVGGELQTSDAHPEVRFMPFAEVEELFSKNLIRGSHVALALAAALAGTQLPDDALSMIPASLPPVGGGAGS